MSEPEEPIEGEVVEEPRRKVPPEPPGPAQKLDLKFGEGGIEIKTIEEGIRFATSCFNSGLLPDHIRNGKQAFVILCKGQELGLKPFAAWEWIYPTKTNRLAIMSKGALAVCQASPVMEDYREWIEYEGTDQMRGCAEAKRKKRSAVLKTFSLADAQEAKLLAPRRTRDGRTYEGPWQLFPKDQLLARARGRALDIAFGDILGGMPVEGVAEDIDRLEADRRRPPVAPQTAGLPADVPDEGTDQPKRLTAGKPDPLLLHVLKGQQRTRTPEARADAAPALEPTPEQRQQIERDVDEALGPPTKRAPEAPPKPAQTTHKVGDIIHGNRRVVEVDEDGRVTVVEKINESEERALRGERDSQARKSASPAEARSAGEEAGVGPARGSGREGGDVRSAKVEALAAPSATQQKRCPREYCGTPLNLLGDCDNCGWPRANLLKR